MNTTEIGVTMTISLRHGQRVRVDKLCGHNRSAWCLEAIMQRVEREERAAKKVRKG